MKNHTTSKAPVYCVFYMNTSYYTTINRELKEKGYGKKVKAIIPTVNIFRGDNRGKPTYEEVPLLFSYAFMRMPRELAYSRDFMNKLKREITGIRCWVTSTENLHSRRKRKRIDTMEFFDDFSQVATVPKSDIRRFRKMAKENKVFAVQDLIRIKPGDYITLKSYPFEGVDATVLNVNHNTKEVKLLMYPSIGKMEITLPFYKVIDTVYSNYNPDIFGLPMEMDMSKITDDAISDILNLRQY